MIPPAKPARSMSTVRCPLRAAESAAARPAQPPPQTSTSVSIEGVSARGSATAWRGMTAAPAASPAVCKKVRRVGVGIVEERKGLPCTVPENWPEESGVLLAGLRVEEQRDRAIID